MHPLPTESNQPGAVVQLVRMPACHAGGRGFESLPHRQNASQFSEGRFWCIGNLMGGKWGLGVAGSQFSLDS